MNQLRSSTPLVTVATVTCDMPRSGLTEPYHVSRTWIGFPLSGVFRIHHRDEEHLVHTGVGAAFPAGSEYRMTHPVDGGDTDVALMYRDDLIEEALPIGRDRVRVTRLDLRSRHLLGLLLAALRNSNTQLSEELALNLLAAIATNLDVFPAPMVRTASRKKIDRLRILLAEHPELPWTLETLARLVGYSPFHLAHRFRAHTGTSVHRYLADLRLAAALQRIEAGDASLATIAADVGFAHHSHLTATMRRRLGLTPRAIRARLRALPANPRDSIATLR